MMPDPPVTYIYKIINAIHEMYALNVETDNIKILFGPVVEIYILREMNSFNLSGKKDFSKVSFFMGCEIKNDHCNNNEIIVFDISDFNRSKTTIIPFIKL